MSDNQKQHHIIPIHNWQTINYFMPMTLSQLTIQLYAETKWSLSQRETHIGFGS